MMRIDDQIRSETEYRYRQLLADAEARRLVARDRTASATERTRAIVRLWTSLFSQRRTERAAAATTDTTAVAAAPVPTMGRERTSSVANACDGPCVHERAAA